MKVNYSEKVVGTVNTDIGRKNLSSAYLGLNGGEACEWTDSRESNRRKDQRWEHSVLSNLLKGKVCIPAEQKGEFRASKDRRLWCASLHCFGGMSWYPRSVTPDERPLSWGKAPWQLAHETGFSQIWEVRIRFLFCTCCWVFGPFRDLRFDDVQSIFTYLIWFAHLIWFFRYTTQVKYHYSHFTGKETEIKRG